MQICKNSNKQLALNFMESEFYSGSFNAPDCHYLDTNLIKAVQIIRNYYGVPVAINSTFRTVEHNLSIGGASHSQHLTGHALDFTFSDKTYLDLYYNEIVNKGELYYRLKAIGINGLGMYDTFMHIDTRPNSAFWDNSKKKV